MMRIKRLIAVLLGLLLLNGILISSLAESQLGVFSPDRIIGFKDPAKCTDEELASELNRYVAFGLFIVPMVEYRERIAEGEDISTDQIIESLDPNLILLLDSYLFESSYEHDIELFLKDGIELFLNESDDNIQFIVDWITYGINEYHGEIVARTAAETDSEE